MLIHEIKKSPGLNKKSKRLGRGNSSGKGNYSTRGLKGQGSRSGSGMPAWFEGGQTPLVQRLPKLRGFKNAFHKKNYQVVNLFMLEKDERISSGNLIDKNVLKEYRYISNVKGLVKILAKGNISKKLDFIGIDAFSNAAKEKIESLGGKINSSS